MPVLLLKAAIPGGAAGDLFAAPVHVQGYTRGGTYVAPYAATRHKLAAQPPEWKMTRAELNPEYLKRNYGALSLDEFLKQSQLAEVIAAADGAKNQSPAARKAAFERAKGLFNPDAYQHIHPAGQPGGTPALEATPAKPAGDDRYPYEASPEALLRLNRDHVPGRSASPAPMLREHPPAPT